MGQYYNAVFLDAEGRIRAWLCGHSYGSGVKLMEHSYIGNRFMESVEWLLSPVGYFHKCRLVWGGDYADPEDNGKTHYDMCYEQEDQEVVPEPKKFNAEDYPYLVNHTRKEFTEKPAKGEFIIHPLSLLTAEGNGRGGGDYRGEHEDLIGRWARDLISVEKEVPEGFTELLTEFCE